MKRHYFTTQRLLLISLLILLLFLGFSVIKYFIVPVVWAAIIAYMTWPIYTWLQRKMTGVQRPTLSATVMLLFIILLVGIPFITSIFLLQKEGYLLYQKLHHQLLSGRLPTPSFLRDIPFIGQEIVRMIQEFNRNPGELQRNIGTWVQEHLSYGRFVLNEISKNLVKIFFALFSLFFFYRDGPAILRQVSRAIEMVIGPRIHHYLDTISETTRAVVYGIGLTALAQSLLAGLSYFVAGVPNPMLLTLMTFVLALIPFGTPVAYGSVSLWLLSQGLYVEAIGVMAWGVLIVSSSDNVIRPLVISGATQIPFLLIMFGVLGGIASFGLIGLFIGPVVLAILLAIWREWIHETTEKAADEPLDHLIDEQS
ncbi:MAG: AI-2E family transporter [Acinetobacter sp.]|nr:AI-2E family transporter [Acinetobacter sp.]